MNRKELVERLEQARAWERDCDDILKSVINKLKAQTPICADGLKAMGWQVVANAQYGEVCRVMMKQGVTLWYNNYFQSVSLSHATDQLHDVPLFNITTLEQVGQLVELLGGE